MTPEQKQEQINQLQHTQTVVARSGFGIRKAAELVASDIEDLYINDNDIRWLQLHQQALLLHTEIRLLSAVRENEITETLTHLKENFHA